MDALVKKVNRLILLTASGDKSALGRLFELTAGYLKNMAFGYVRDKSMADDVVSEVYLKVVRYSEKFDPEQNGLNWLFKITKNTALNVNSYEARRAHEDIDAARDVAAAFDALSSAGLMRACVADAVKSLDKDERELIYMKYWEGYTVRELAAFYKMSPSTVQDRLKRILKRLKKIL